MEQYTPDFAEVLNDCADRLASGQTINDCLRAYPEHAEQLFPLLQAAQLPRRARANPAEVNAARLQVSTVLDTLLEDFTIQPQPRIVSLRLLQTAAVLLFAIGVVILFSVLRGNNLPTVYEIPLSQTAVPALGNTESPTETTSPTSTTTSTVSPSSTPTQTLTATQTATQTMTVTPAPTSTPTASATSTASQTPQEPTPLPSSEPALQAPPTALPDTEPGSSPTTGAVGCMLRIPEGWEDYTVKPGDTLSAIALASGTSVDLLIAANCLPASALLVVGQRIYVPKKPDDSVLEQERSDIPQEAEDSAVEDEPDVDMADEDDDNRAESEDDDDDEDSDDDDSDGDDSDDDDSDDD